MYGDPVHPRLLPRLIKTTEDLVQGLIASKNRNYGRLARLKSSGSTEEARAEQRVLFEIHMSLAYTFYDNAILVDPSTERNIRTVQWHAEYAVDLWKRLNPGQAFPIELLDEGMQTEKLKKYIGQ